MAPCEFHWILPQQLAGSGQPGLLNDIEVDIDFIRHQHISLVISLLENEMPEYQRNGLNSLHFPIVDMQFPLPRPTLVICQRIQDELESGGRVLVHCRAGLGRTGVILACYLTFRGADPECAIGQIRKFNRSYVQTSAQEQFVVNYSQMLRSDNRAESSLP